MVSSSLYMFGFQLEFLNDAFEFEKFILKEIPNYPRPTPLSVVYSIHVHSNIQGPVVQN